MGRPGSRLPTSRGSTRPHPFEARRTRPSRDGHALVLCWVPVEVQTPAPVALSTAYLRRRRSLRAHRGRCSRFHVRRFVEALALGQKIVQPFREASTAPSEARSSLSAFVLGERRGRGDARRSSRRCRPIGENSDYQISTPSPRRIRARRILTKRCRGAGAVLRTPRRARRWRRVRIVRRRPRRRRRAEVPLPWA